MNELNLLAVPLKQIILRNISKSHVKLQNLYPELCQYLKFEQYTDAIVKYVCTFKIEA